MDNSVAIAREGDGWSWKRVWGDGKDTIKIMYDNKKI